MTKLRPAKLAFSTLVCTMMLASGTGCSSMTIKAEVKPGHFRFENFMRDKGPKNERMYAYLMCYNQRPTMWAQPRQYEEGEHHLWVKVIAADGAVINSKSEAITDFTVHLPEGKSYMLNRKTYENSNKIDVWIQEVDTGLLVSDVKTIELDRPKVVKYQAERDMCESSTI
ncbi:hypothetical protein [Bowmanella sp. JS7-9]|uniref:DUF2846 domain-containing protein n=1 Tax=Pseudobowmanella zhangzhouensis TaxID=1537679 RepID=A0ABW1XJD8_9ALTE|nr:hypothetical protein [Bowmanella sp. JS7-9]TBX23155.1 hypothetical protein TK45_08075 [Bowmanella sp. JS7-9]